MPSFRPYILFILIQLSHKMVYAERHKYDTVSSIQPVRGGEMHCAALVIQCLVEVDIQTEWGNIVGYCISASH